MRPFPLYCALSLLTIACGSTSSTPKDATIFDATADGPLTTDMKQVESEAGITEGSPEASPPMEAGGDLLPGEVRCLEDAHCDDGLACTANRCEDERCVTTPLSDCAWPAELIDAATNLTEIEGPIWANEFHADLSGAVWNPKTRQLWLCRNTASDSRVWVLEEDGLGGFRIGDKNGQRGEWADFGDLEGLTLADFDAPETLYLIVERQGLIQELDFSVYGTKTINNSWNVTPNLISGDGAEAITFVPDSFLQRDGFVDASGQPYTSKGGMGGLMLVGHQTGGHIYIFDLNRDDGSFAFVGRYKTAKDETAGLEFDRSTGQLFIWHDSDHDQLEVARLSSSVVGGERKLTTVKIYNGPGKILLGSDNHEGIALTSSDDCVDGKRGFFLTTDGGKLWSLMWFKDFPCAP